MPFTIFCLGSGQSYDPKKRESNINHDFFEACGDPKKIYDGPKRLKGMYDPWKVQENIDDAKSNLKNWLSLQTGDKPYRINLTGFSRGAVTCLKIANALQEMLDKGELKDQTGKTLKREDIEVNIFAEDPVAGLFEKKLLSGRHIPPIVRHYVATLQVDEIRKGFKPQDLSRIHATSYLHQRITFLPMYGNHSAINKYRKEENSGVAINYHLKNAFLTQHGTKLTFDPNNAPTLENTPALEKYAKFHLEKNKHFSEGVEFQYKDIPGPGKMRGFTRYLSDYVIDPFFVNQHERELFKQTYPKLFNYLFEKNRQDLLEDKPNYKEEKHTGKYCTAEGMAKEIEQMGMTNPSLLKYLTQEKKIPLPNSPQGTSRIERCQFLNSLNGKQTIYEDKYEVKNALIEKRLLEKINRYRIKKASYNMFSQKTHLWRTEQMRIDMQTILGSKDSSEVKYRKLLNMIEKHVIELEQRNTGKSLINPLKKILQQNDYSYEVKQKPRTFLSGVGAAIRGLGIGVRAVGRFIGLITGTVGAFLEDTGQRLIDWSTTGWRSKTLILPLLLVAWVPLKYAGTAIIFVGSLVDKLGDLIKAGGEKIIQKSEVTEVAVKAPVKVIEPANPPEVKPSSTVKIMGFTAANSPNKVNQLDNKHDEKNKNPDEAEIPLLAKQFYPAYETSTSSSLKKSEQATENNQEYKEFLTTQQIPLSAADLAVVKPDNPAEVRGSDPKTYQKCFENKEEKEKFYIEEKLEQQKPVSILKYANKIDIAEILTDGVMALGYKNYLANTGSNKTNLTRQDMLALFKEYTLNNNPITQESLRTFLNECNKGAQPYSFFNVTANMVATKLMHHYTNETECVFESFTLPAVSFTRVALEQIKGYIERYPNQEISLTTYFDPHYKKAFELVCAALELKGGYQYRFREEEITAFKKYCEINCLELTPLQIAPVIKV